MNREDIIRMAREAGWEMDDSLVLEPEVIWYISQGQIERFAALVASAEREACAKVCEQRSDPLGCANLTAEACASAIRARGQA